MTSWSEKISAGTSCLHNYNLSITASVRRIEGLQRSSQSAPMPVPVLTRASSRSRCTSRLGGTPKRLLYSRLKCEASWYPTREAAIAASRSSPIIRRWASCSRSCFWNCKGLLAVTALKWWWKPDTLISKQNYSIIFDNYSTTLCPKVPTITCTRNSS